MTYAAALVLAASASALSAPASPEAASFPEAASASTLCAAGSSAALSLSAAADAESAVLARMASCTSCSSICAEALAGELSAEDSGFVSLSVRPVRYQLPLWRVKR